MLLARDNIKLPTRQSNNILDTSMKECLVVNYHRSMMLKLKNLLDKNVLGKLTYWSGREKVQDNINLKCYQSTQAFNIFLIRCATKWYTYIKCKIWETQEIIMLYSGLLKQKRRPLVSAYNNQSERNI